MNKYAALLHKHAENSRLDESLSLSTFLSKSPFVEGLKTGIKAGLIGAGAGAGYGALTRMGPKKGLVRGGVSGLMLGALIGAGAQEVSNRRSEADMSYHMRRLMARHPGITVPPEVVARMIAEEGGATIGAGSARAFEHYGSAPVNNDPQRIY
jgi:hypothetical protein